MCSAQLVMQTGSGNFNAWRMLTGPGTPSETFAVFNDPNYVGNPNNVILQAKKVGSVMEFRIGGNLPFVGAGPITRMIITDGAYSVNSA